MKVVHINTSKKYDVMIRSGLLAQGVDFSDGKRVCLVSDDTVYTLYGSLVHADAAFVFPHGEGSKNLETYGKLLQFLSEHHFDRGDMIAALGGGVTGDLAGFAAATYLRGIEYIQIPTSLLAMVDSSVGGKTAVDLPTGKNLAGAFYQPSLVLCDPQVLSSLPELYTIDGMAEVVKCAILLGEPDLIHQPCEEMIARCITLKKELVEADEMDRGTRMLLNLGHTFGHAIEQLSGYTISHGRAVAMGIAKVARGTRDEEVILSMLHEVGLPTDCPYDETLLKQAMKADKKRINGKLSMVIPKALGACVIEEREV